VLVDGANTIIAGHGRVEAAKQLKISEVPTIRLENLSADQIRAYIVADNTSSGSIVSAAFSRIRSISGMAKPVTVTSKSFSMVRRCCSSIARMDLSHPAFSADHR
jgi:hypothetical protein